MNKYIAILIFLFTSVNTSAQANWHFIATIEETKSYLFEGTIANKYQITMYLEHDGFCLYDNKWNYAHSKKMLVHSEVHWKPSRQQSAERCVPFADIVCAWEKMEKINIITTL